MKQILYFSLLVIVIFSAGSCQKDIIDTNSSSKLSFSTDSILFDTIFVSVGSVTKSFKVYNKNDKTLKIDFIKLGSADQSNYRLNIDGYPANELKDYEIAPNDSFYIFVEVTIDPNNKNLPFVVSDSVIFMTNGNLQDVKLDAWGQNANFYNAQHLKCNEVWDSDLPYVIYNSVQVDSNCKLTIKEGTQIYSHPSSAFIVYGTVEAGNKDFNTIGKPIVFKGDRMQERYKHLPGQWYGLWFAPSSKDNYFKDVEIRNAVVGMEADSLSTSSKPKLKLINVKIENMTAVALLGYTANIEAYNCLFNNSCQHLIVGDLGGSYKFINCTFANSACACMSRKPSLIFTNQDYMDKITNDLNLEITNSIIWGTNSDEIEFQKIGKGSFNVKLSYSLIKTKLNDLNINNNILNKKPLLYSPCNDYNYELDTLSPAINKGILLPEHKTILKYDIRGQQRTDTISMGAYKYK